MTMSMSSTDPMRDYEQNRYADFASRRNSADLGRHQLAGPPNGRWNSKLPQVKGTTFMMLLFAVAVGFAAIMAVLIS
jgi:hypothetical protein